MGSIQPSLALYVLGMLEEETRGSHPLSIMGVSPTSRCVGETRVGGGARRPPRTEHPRRLNNMKKLMQQPKMVVSSQKSYNYIYNIL